MSGDVVEDATTRNACYYLQTAVYTWCSGVEMGMSRYWLRSLKLTCSRQTQAAVSHSPKIQYQIVQFDFTRAFSNIALTWVTGSREQTRMTWAACVIQAHWAKRTTQCPVSHYQLSVLEKRCIEKFSTFRLSNLRTTNKARLHLVRGPLLTVLVALEWLVERLRPIVSEPTRIGILGLVQRPRLLAVK
jgi:hypothetical protein